VGEDALVAGVELIGVPFDGYGRPGNQAAASGVLRAAGLARAFGAQEVTDRGDLELPAPDRSRGEATSLVNQTALLAMVDRVGESVSRAVEQGRFPVVHGGDCTTLLGTIPALHRSGSIGLLFVDGHEDTMPLDVSEDGEAANTEIGLLLGLTGRLLKGPLSDRRGVLDRHHIAVLGPRDEVWRQRFNVGSLREHGVWFRDWQQTSARPEEHARDAVHHLHAAAQRWWLHLDLDVLDPDEFAAQGVPGESDTPNGLGWDALTRLLITAVGQGGCIGWSVAIYDPEQDPSRAEAGRIVRLVTDVASVMGQEAPLDDEG
jgi:arginase